MHISFKNTAFDIELDPKSDWAVNNLGIFPIEINSADYSMLLRVPGIGIRSAQRIISSRRVSSLSYDDLKKLGVVLKRARYFITCSGKYYGGTYTNKEILRQSLKTKPPKRQNTYTEAQQISIFSYLNTLPPAIT